MYNTIPFGWKASAYLYHTIGMAATSYVRSLGVPCSQYIDDRHVGQLAPCQRPGKPAMEWSNFEYADAAAFFCPSILISLGYFIGLSKSSLVLQQVFRIYPGLDSLCLSNPRSQRNSQICVNPFQKVVRSPLKHSAFCWKNNVFLYRHALSSTVCS